MLPAIYNPTIKQGVPFRRQMIVTDAAGVAINLTGATVKGELRDPAGTILATMACTVLDALAGKLELLIVDTTGLLPTNGQHLYPYDVFITPAAGDRICPIEGLACVEAKTTGLP